MHLIIWIIERKTVWKSATSPTKRNFLESSGPLSFLTSFFEDGLLRKQPVNIEKLLLW